MGSRAITEPLVLTTDYVSIDGRYTGTNGNPYASVAAADAALGRRINQYTVGLTVLVKESGWTEAKEYWVQPKGTTPETYGLVSKGSSDIDIDTEKIEGGTRVTITDADGTQHSFDVKDGESYSTGYYYGQFTDESSLPDASTLENKGYAYVASTDPSVYYIYLFEGTGSNWENSGKKFVTTALETNLATKSQTKAPTTKAVAEGIETVNLLDVKSTPLTVTQKYNASANINDRAADVAPITGEIKALGYKVLNPSLSFAEQVENIVENEVVTTNNSNTIFEIRDEFDLNGGSVIIPANCTLKFNGGKLSNGTITGSNTVIDGNLLFKEIAFAGSYVCKHIFSKDFEYATDDAALTAVFQFLNCIKKDVVCELEAKTYDIDYKSSISGNTIFSKWKLDNCSNITINGNGAVLNHTNPLTDTQQGSAQLNSILKLNSCTYITIKELTYQRLDGYDTNYQGACVGVCVIFFEGNNSFLDISMTAKNARSALGNHIYAPALTDHIGLVSDSVFNIKQYHTGYGVTFSWIANSKINVESHGQHRCVYLTGASNCDVYLEWEDQWTAPIACLIGNSWTGGSDNLVWHSCKDLNIVSICTQKTANANDATVTKYCAGLGSTEEPRTIGLTMQNINITTNSLYGLGNGFVAVLSQSPSTDDTVKDYYKNFTFTISNGSSRFDFHDNRVIQNFTIVNSRISGVIFANFNTSSKLIFRDSYIAHALIGKGTYNFINTDIKKLSDNDGKSSKTNTLIYFDNCFITDTSNLTIKATISSSMLPYKSDYFWAFSLLCNETNCDASRVMMPNYRDNALNYGKLLIQTSNNGTSANRPQNAQDLKVGVMYFDTTLKKPIWYNGTSWVDGNGETVGLQVSDTSVLIGAAADSSVTINVYHANALTVSALNPDNTPATWLTVPSNIAVGTNTLTISAAENTASNPRGAKVIISDGTDVVIVNVVQNYTV